MKNKVIVTSYQQAENIWFLAGYVPSDEVCSATQLPSIKAWFPNTPFESPVQRYEDASCDMIQVVNPDYESDVGDESDSEVPEAMQLQVAMDRTEKLKLSFSEEDEVNNLIFAAVAISVNDSMEM